MQLNSDEMQKELKKLKKHTKEKKTYEKIINHIKQSNNFKELQSNPISRMYEYEPLKYDLNGFHSFNLANKGGVIRLIFSVDEEFNLVKLEFISMEHYEDFKRKIRK